MKNKSKDERDKRPSEGTVFSEYDTYFLLEDRTRDRLIDRRIRRMNAKEGERETKKHIVKKSRKQPTR